MTKNMLLGSVGVTTAVFSAIYFVSGDYLLAAFSLAAGLAWLYLEIRWQGSSASIFFLIFFILGIAASLRGLPTLIILLGLSTNLAAWDLSRLWVRIANRAEGDVKVALETRHLQKLGAVTAAGLIIALLALSVQISLSFVAFAVITFLVMIALRISMLYARKEDRIIP